MVPKISWAKQIEADLKTKNKDLDQNFEMISYNNYYFSQMCDQNLQGVLDCAFMYGLLVLPFLLFFNQYLKLIINQILQVLDADWSVLQLC